MNHVKKILAPTDLSKLSLTGLRYAFNLARSFGAEVTVYHVINRDEIMQFSEQLKRFGNPVAIGRHTENLLEESQEALSHFLRDNLADLLPLVEVRTKVEMGLPYKNIVERAREDGADMIVMSTHGRTGFSHVLLGSVTEKVVRTAPCPVVSIHPEEEGESSERKNRGRLAQPRRAASRIGFHASRLPSSSAKYRPKEGLVMESLDFVKAYQWNYRPKTPKRPAWFTSGLEERGSP